MLGLIPRPVHGVIDYLWSLAFMAAPNLFGFADDQNATTFCRAMGGGALTWSLFTRYELGLVKVLPFNVHLLLDTLSALLGAGALAGLPFGRNVKARNAILGFLVSEVGVLLLTKRDPQ